MSEETIDISELERPERPITVTCQISPEVRKNVLVWYRPSLISTDLQCALMNIRDAGAAERAYKEQFCEIISRWNLVSKGEPVPLTPERVGKFDFELIAGIMNAVLNDNRPNLISST